MLTKLIILGTLMAGLGTMTAQGRFVRPDNDKVPPGNEQAAAELRDSRLKSEWVNVPFASGRPINTFVVYPTREKAPVVILIHGQYGLSIWARGVANQVAEDGYIALSPDMLSGLAPGGGRTPEAGGDAAAEKILFAMPMAEAMNRIKAVAEYAKTMPSWNGKLGLLGFTWGGTRAFEAAAALPNVQATVVYHCPSPQDVSLFARIESPVLGLYAGDDPRANPTIEPTRAVMAKLGKSYEIEVYPGIRQGFIRSQLEETGANYRATEAAWARTLGFLSQHLR